jgi:hypothetical protein
MPRESLSLKASRKTRLITANGKQALRLPVLIQPGQAQGTIGIPLGYGRTKAGKVADKHRW